MALAQTAPKYKAKLHERLRYNIWASQWNTAWEFG